jgi:hypothetical protein
MGKVLKPESNNLQSLTRAGPAQSAVHNVANYDSRLDSEGKVTVSDQSQRESEPGF